jgi:hypothetical protein
MHQARLDMVQFKKSTHWVQSEWTKHDIWKYMDFKVNEMGIALSLGLKIYHGKDNGYYRLRLIMVVRNSTSPFAVSNKIESTQMC